MKVKVHMLAFTDGEIRMVDIPDDTLPYAVLGATFHFGQNESPSVSMGDVIEHNGQYWRVEGVGFKSLTTEEFAEYKEKDLLQRILESFGT